MALLLFLIIPLLLAGGVYVAVTGYNKFRDSRLNNYVDSDVESTEAIGDEWQATPVERGDVSELDVVSYNDAEKVFKSFIADEEKDMKPEPDVDDRYWGDTPEKVRAYNRARVRMSEWLVDKHVRHITGFQRCDFLAMNPEKPIPQPMMNERKRLENLMGDVKLSWTEVYTIVWKEVQKATPGFSQHEDLVRSSLAQQIRDKERQRCTEEFLGQLKEIQKKVEDEQFALTLEKQLLTERVASLLEEVKKKDRELESLKSPFDPFDCLGNELPVKEEAPPLEIVTAPRKRKPIEKAKKTKRKN